MSIAGPWWNKLFGGALQPTDRTREVSAETPDRVCAKYDAARMIRQLRQRRGLSQAQFADRLGLRLQDVCAAELGTADYQHTMDMRDRAQTMLGYDASDPDVQPQAERGAATLLAAWVRDLPD